MVVKSNLNILDSLKKTLIKNILFKIKKEVNVKLNFLTLTLPEGMEPKYLFKYETKFLRYFKNNDIEYLHLIGLEQNQNLYINILIFQDMKDILWRFRMRWNKTIGASKEQGFYYSEVTYNPKNIRNLIFYMFKDTANIKRIKKITELENGKRRVLLSGSKMFTDSLIKYKGYKKKKKKIEDKNIKKMKKNGKSRITYKTTVKKKERN